MSAINKNEGKARLGLVLKDFAHAIEALARLRENNLKKYDRDNWGESIGAPDAKRFLEENLESIQRHVSSLWKGEELDIENGDHHATAIMCRVCFILEYYYRQKDSVQVIEPTFGEYGFKGNRLTGEPIEEKKTLYDWSKIPEQYKWCATDYVGEVYAYTQEPKKFINAKSWDASKSVSIALIREGCRTCEDWEASLEARPT